MNIDWSKAPEWANAVVAASAGTLYFVEAFGVRSKRQAVSNSYACGLAADMTIKSHLWKLIEERPKKQEAWDGEGLPPIGITCEAELYHGGGWIEGFVAYYGKAHFIFESNQLTVGVEISGKIRTSAFRPIKTAEQLAGEERKSQLEVMHKIYMEGASEHKGGLAALYDAGYKLAK